MVRFLRRSRSYYINLEAWLQANAEKAKRGYVLLEECNLMLDKQGKPYLHELAMSRSYTLPCYIGICKPFQKCWVVAWAALQH